MASPVDKDDAPINSPNAEELAALMVQYGPALKRYFARKIGPIGAEDLVQEVFLRLQSRATQTPTENVERFLFTIAKRVLVDRHRFDSSRSAKQHQSFNEALDGADDISPERVLAAKQDYARASVAIIGLPPLMRSAFMLHRFDKLSYSAIAKRMGISKPLVQKLMKRAIERIVAELESGS